MGSRRGLPKPPKPTSNRLKRLHPNIWVATLTSLLTDISSEMLVYLIPLFLSNVLGMRTAIIGLIDGVAETTASLLKVYSGALSDRFRTRKWLAVAGYGISTVAKPFLYFASSWGWVMGVRFADRIGKGIRNPPRDALVAASANDDQRGMAFGLHRAGDTAGAFLGIAAAAGVIWWTQSGDQQLSRLTFQTAVLISILPAALAVVVLALGAREVRSSTGAPSSVGLTFRGFDRRFLYFLGVVVVFTLGNSSDSFIVLRGQERGLTLLQIMGMLMTFTLVYAVASGPLGQLSDRVGRTRLILGGWLLYAVVYLGLAGARSGWHVWVLFALYGGHYAATEGVMKALVADLVPDANRGTAYGLFNAAIGLAALPASLVAGVLWQGVGPWKGFGPASPFLFGSATALLASFLLWRLVGAQRASGSGLTPHLA